MWVVAQRLLRRRARDQQRWHRVLAWPLSSDAQLVVEFARLPLAERQ